ncbi:ATG7 [[Candida] subhashii]|uniref:Ubiquitin-like modifier-activating enzyme ATG7 n=1 Tax=[Candida] subhashii TaxID=561895 RepID=A0A8J5QL08_9ASCO|nr:ATG7 [[Candida] subhashii]KAG7662621.1 ATG7 [[Candida] subhashii]
MNSNTTTTGSKPKYAMTQSFIESSFFIKLSQLKLDTYKLDSTSHEIWGFVPHPQKLNKFNDVPILSLDQDSFSNEERVEDRSKVYIKGEIYNVNTIEEFKTIDKQKLLTDWGMAIREKLISEDNRLDVQLFNRFHILSFSDLKIYKFYYSHRIGHNLSLTLNELVLLPLAKDIEEVISKKLNERNGFQQLYQLVDNKLEESISLQQGGNTFIFFDSCTNKDKKATIQLKNYLYYLAYKGFTNIELIIYRKDGSSFSQKLQLQDFSKDTPPKIIGWERTSQGKLGPKVADLASLIDPHKLAEQATELNLKLMKWRIAPDLNLDIIKEQKVLLLGAGTLGCYVARSLMGWGVHHITFVDSGRVSYSNPVRQPLFTFNDCFSDNGLGQYKAIQAAEALKEIYPNVNSQGVNLDVPMIGHPVTDEKKQRADFEKLVNLFEEHDVVFLLMDSRESRWLPTVLGNATNKIVINAALGFDSYLVMRHGSPKQKEDERLGCYYCNDVVAPSDSLTDRTLDQMCTVTRPGGSIIASALAVELLVSILQHPNKQLATQTDKSKLGSIPHQIRGFLHGYQQTNLHTPNYKYCSGCSDGVLEQFKEKGWTFIKNCLNDSGYLEDVCGLRKIQEEAELATEKLLQELSLDEDDEEWIS